MDEAAREPGPPPVDPFWVAFGGIAAGLCAAAVEVRWDGAAVIFAVLSAWALWMITRPRLTFAFCHGSLRWVPRLVRRPRVRIVLALLLALSLVGWLAPPGYADTGTLRVLANLLGLSGSVFAWLGANRREAA